MKHLAISTLFCLWWAYGTLAQNEERVTWSPQSADAPSVPFHQFVGAGEPTPATHSIAQWAGWDAGERLVCTSTSDSLRVVVVHLPRTWTLALWNDAEQKTKVVIEGELPAGVYTVERLLLADGGEVVAVERRNGLHQRVAGKVSRTEWLAGRSGLVLRFVERTQTVEETLSQLRRSIWQSGVSPNVLSRLAALLREMDSHWYQVRASLRKNDVRLAARGVHRMLFLASGVRVASSKYAGSAQVAERAESLVDSLSELSSAILNVVVSVRCEGDRLSAQVTNAGTQIWDVLRLVPHAGADEAMVLTDVKPMERAEASLKLTEQQSVPAVVLSVLLNGGYARLRVPYYPAEENKEERP